ncbi:MAG TPA: hypothetical protein VHC98_02775 [Candidatus Saccharimonadales bacterium]|nr:hypothetical protein [Candidatus Saccharimonadales bacterium]
MTEHIEAPYVRLPVVVAAPSVDIARQIATTLEENDGLLVSWQRHREVAEPYVRVEQPTTFGEAGLLMEVGAFRAVVGAMLQEWGLVRP